MISYSTYKELLAVQDESLISKMVSMICIVNDEVDEDVLNWPMKDIKNEYERILKVVQSISDLKQLTPVIEVEELGRLHFKSISEMSLGEYIDLEYFMKEEMYDEMLTVLYRKKEVNKYHPDKWEPWGGYSTKRSNIYDDLPADQIVGAINSAYAQKIEFLDKWSILFDGDRFDYENELINPDLTDEERQIIEDERKKDEQRASLKFERLINVITDGNMLEIDRALVMNIEIIFKFLVVQKQIEQIK